MVSNASDLSKSISNLILVPPLMPLYSMLQVLSGVKAETVSNMLPKELSVVVNDLSADMPTHMLVVYSRQVAGSCPS